MSITPDNLLQRLDELRKWQEQQHEILLQKQVSQREVLNMEKQKLYEMFGLSMSSDALNCSEDVSCNIAKNDSHPAGAEEQQDDGIEMLDDTDETESDDNGTKEDPVVIVHDANVHTIPINHDNLSENNDVIPKRTFLKRGQGLQARFGVNPDHFRLDKLPKYKYANRQKKATDAMATKQKAPETIVIEPRKKSPAIIPKVPSGELQLKKPLHIQTKTKSIQRQPSIDEDVLQNFDKLCSEQIKINSNQRQLPIVSDESNTKPLTWSNVLDSQNIEPVPVNRGKSIVDLQDTPVRNRVYQQQQEIDDLNIFELIEKNSNQSGLSNSSVLQRFLQQHDKQPANQICVSPNDPLICQSDVQRKQQLIQPFPFDIQRKIRIDESECDTITDEQQNSDDSEDGDDSEEDERKSDDKQIGSVRFASKNIVINEMESECETLMSTDIDDVDLSKTSTPNTKAAFEAFKAKIFGKYMLEETPCYDINESTATATNQNQSIVEPLQIELKQNTEMLRQRLDELEKEIEMFRQQNAALTKAKQDHELEKIQLCQERQEMLEQLSDERIKIEVYLHDERMKIADENAKLEKRSKDLRAPNRKDRDEMQKLRERVAELEKELTNRDQKHVAAQGRLRAQLRTMEKDLKEYGFEIDNLRKENKKCESENIRLRRQGNNKLLQEINKNIAKLAPPPTANDDQSKPSNTKPLTTRRSHPITNQNAQKPVVAKVVSHRNGDRVTTIRSAKSVPNLAAEQQQNESTDSDSDSDSSMINNGQQISTEKSAYFQNEKPRKKPPIPLTETGTIATSQIDQDNSQSTNNNEDEMKSLKREILNADGSKDIWYPNGNLKKISGDAMIIRMLYFNKDIKETNINEGTVKYYYADTNTWHTSYLDGLEILEFPNGQTEHRYKDGTVEVHFPNGSIRIANPNNMEIAEEWKFADGTTVVQKRDGDKLLTLPNGQREVHTKKHKRREYPDGTVKLVYPDGSQETRYSNGRIRLKDKDGNLVMDSENTFATS